MHAALTASCTHLFTLERVGFERRYEHGLDAAFRELHIKDTVIISRGVCLAE